MVRRVAFAAFLALAGCGDFPRDSEGSLEKAKAGAPLNVGYSVAAPWVTAGDGGPTGIEPDLIRAWAREEGVRLRWVEGGESQLVEGLHQGTLDLAVAGLTNKMPHGARLGTTQPYLTAEIVVGAVPGAAVPESWKSVPIAYHPDRPHIAAAIEKAKAVPRPAGEGGTVYAAAYKEELAPLGLADTGKSLASEKRLIATAPAENALAYSLDRFLHARREAIRARLAAEGRR